MGKSYTLVEEVETKPWEHGNVCKISKENNMCYSDIVFPCPVKNYRSSKYIYLFHIFMNVYHIFISLFQHFTIHHYTILPLHHFISFPSYSYFYAEISALYADIPCCLGIYSRYRAWYAVGGGGCGPCVARSFLQPRLWC